MSTTDLLKAISEATSGETKSGYEDSQLREMIHKRNSILPYYVQGCRELGLYCYNFSGVDGTYITADEAAAAGRFLDNSGRYSKFNDQWDGGALMTDVRDWVSTETSANIIFVYGGLDPWTGGGIDPASVEANPHVKYILNEMGGHSSAFLDPAYFTEAASKEIAESVMAGIR